jgi:sugar-phosphatase
MDGLLADTEPLWRKAEKKVFKQVNINLTDEMTASTVGLKINEVVDHWFKLYPWNELIPKEKIVNDVLDELERLIDKEGKEMEGTDYIISYFNKTGLKIALASSSPVRMINFILNKFKIKDRFEVIHSGEFEKCGKPDPAIYLTTAGKLGINPESCLAFEDSYYGLLSAKKAGMKTVCIPDPEFYNDNKFDIADIKLNSLHEFNDEHLKYLNSF